MEHYADVDEFLAHATRWDDECVQLRAILLACGLGEAIKWGKPCYTHNGSNIAIMQPFNDFLALMFFKGALVEDPDGLLQEQGDNTRSARRLCFASVEDVAEMEAGVRSLIADAIAVEEEGRELPERPELELVEELEARLDGDPLLKAAFEALTPGRQRGYNLYFSNAKRSSTRAGRVEKHVPRILAGKGLHDA